MTRSMGASYGTGIRQSCKNLILSRKDALVDLSKQRTTHKNQKSLPLHQKLVNQSDHSNQYQKVTSKVLFR